MNIEDTSLLENMKQVQDLVKKILGENEVFGSKEEELFDADGQTDTDDARQVTKPKNKLRLSWVKLKFS